MLHGMGDLVTQHSGKAQVLNAFCASVFASKTVLQELQVPETGKDCSKEDVPLVEEDLVRECLGKLNILQSLGPEWIHRMEC